MRRDYIQQKGYQIVEMLECEWWSLYKTEASVKSHLRKNFSTDVHRVKNDLWKESSTGPSLVTFKVILIYLNTCATLFSNFPPIFKNTAVSRDDIGNLMKLNAEKENIIVQPRRMPHIVDARREDEKQMKMQIRVLVPRL